VLGTALAVPLPNGDWTVESPAAASELPFFTAASLCPDATDSWAVPVPPCEMRGAPKGDAPLVVAVWPPNGDITAGAPNGDAPLVATALPPKGDTLGAGAAVLVGPVVAPAVLGPKGDAPAGAPALVAPLVPGPNGELDAPVPATPFALAVNGDRPTVGAPVPAPLVLGPKGDGPATAAPLLLGPKGDGAATAGAPVPAAPLALGPNGDGPPTAPVRAPPFALDPKDDGPAATPPAPAKGDTALGAPLVVGAAPLPAPPNGFTALGVDAPNGLEPTGPGTAPDVPNGEALLAAPFTPPTVELVAAVPLKGEALAPAPNGDGPPHAAPLPPNGDGPAAVDVAKGDSTIAWHHRRCLS